MRTLNILCRSLFLGILLHGANGIFWRRHGQEASLSETSRSLTPDSYSELGHQDPPNDKFMVEDRHAAILREIRSLSTMGHTGHTGPTGPTGHPGEKGHTGATGPAGHTGEKGHTGATGPTGEKGEKGAMGAQGSTSLRLDFLDPKRHLT